MSRTRFTFADGEPIGPLVEDEGRHLIRFLLVAAALALACVVLT